MTSRDEIAGARLCTYTYGWPRRWCGNQAVAHVLDDQGHRVMSCELHSRVWDIRDHQDRHPTGGECGLPDTTWVRSSDDGPGRCVIDGLDLPDLFATAAELAGQPA